MTSVGGFDSVYFDVQRFGDVVMVIITRTMLADDENLDQLDQDLAALLDVLRVQRVAMDLGAVSYMTSSAIGKLISLHRKLGRAEGRLVLCQLQPNVVQTLDASHLLQYFSVVDDQEAALAKLASGP